MTPETGVILGVGIALVLLILVRRAERKRHDQKLKLLQDRIARSEEAADEKRRRDNAPEDSSRP